MNIGANLKINKELLETRSNVRWGEADAKDPWARANVFPMLIQKRYTP